MSVKELLLRDYLYELYTTDSADGRFQVYVKCLQKLGFEAVTYSLIPRIQFESSLKIDPVFQCSSSYSMKFLDHYINDNLSQNDFTIRNISNNIIQPMDWREHELKNQISSKECSLVELAREDYGITNAISIPTMNEDAGGGGVSITSSEKDATFQKLKKENMDALVFITHRFHESNFQRLQFPQKFVMPFLESLTANEIGIICHLASGKRFKEIEYSIDVASYRVASNAWQNLRKNKLNNMTKERLMYLAGQIDLPGFFR